MQIEWQDVEYREVHEVAREYLIRVEVMVARELHDLVVLLQERALSSPCQEEAKGHCHEPYPYEGNCLVNELRHELHV